MANEQEKKTILVVDDFQVSNEIVSKKLINSGFSVITARDGKEALSHFNGRQIDLVLTDYIMPIMDGVEMAIEIRKQEQYKYIPILLLTSVTDKSRRQKAYEANITGWLQKPFDIDKIIKLIVKLLLA